MNSPPIETTRVFDDGDQTDFAVLSGDYNPMHMDRVQARRTKPGAPVVHGVNGALWALDSLLGQVDLAGGAISSLRVQFTKFIYVGATATATVTAVSEKAIKLAILTDGMVATTIVVGLNEPEAAPGAAPVAYEQVSSALQDLTIEQMADARGTLEPVDQNAAHAAYPILGAKIGGQRLASVIALSRLVGMTCPGLHSIFGSLNLRLAASVDDDLTFRTTTADPRFRLVKMEIAGAGLAGQVTAFARQPPVAQPSYQELAGQVEPNEFSSVNALVLGGSRGLGALVARLIAGGGGQVTVTYAMGQEDACRLRDEINLAAGRDACAIAHFDAMGATDDPVIDRAAFNQVYYFASPMIYRQKERLFVEAIFQEFSHIYLEVFARIVHRLAAKGHPAKVFYPSSTFVTEMPLDMTEYSMAKAAGEILCRQLDRSLPTVAVLCERLPKLLTDQTAGSDVGELSALDVMLPILRRMTAD